MSATSKRPTPAPPSAACSTGPSATGGLAGRDHARAAAPADDHRARRTRSRRRTREANRGCASASS